MTDQQVGGDDRFEELLSGRSPEVAVLVRAADELVRSVDDLHDPRLVPLLQAARRERLSALGRD